MPRIVVKRPAPTESRAGNDAGKAFVIDFSEKKNTLLFKLLIGAFSVLVSVCIAGIVTVILLFDQMNTRMNALLNGDTVLAGDADPPAAAPLAGTALPPLPKEALGRNIKTVDIVPLLEKLPVNSAPARGAGPNNPIVVEDSLNPNASDLQAEADVALESGDHRQAADLYTRAIAFDSRDAISRQNLVSLLLDVARRHDAAREWDAAFESYEKALRVWRGDKTIANSIRRRMQYVAAQVER
jgi:tetratricopeptide (TPR) repeat protein